MELRYDELTKTRLRYWRESDLLLYEATQKELEAIKSAPNTYGQDGSSHVPRLISYEIPGRDDQYVITWEAANEIVFIGTISTVAEMAQRAQRAQRRDNL